MVAAARLREPDVLARLGGDEFAIVLPRSTGRKSIEKVAQRINTILSGSIQLESGEVTVETSIGIALIPLAFWHIEKSEKSQSARIRI